MFKALGVFALAGVFMTQSAWAADAPQANAPASVRTVPAPTQAQRPQVRRSYSYQPMTTYTYSPYNRVMRWNTNMRPADSKALGNY
jgi:hypothetical protein